MIKWGVESWEEHNNTGPKGLGVTSMPAELETSKSLSRGTTLISIQSGLAFTLSPFPTRS